MLPLSVARLLMYSHVNYCPAALWPCRSLYGPYIVNRLFIDCSYFRHIISPYCDYKQLTARQGNRNGGNEMTFKELKQLHPESGFYTVDENDNSLYCDCDDMTVISHELCDYDSQIITVILAESV